jgi:hypothetical protein
VRAGLLNNLKIYPVTSAGSIGMTTVIGNFAAFACGVVKVKLEEI